MEHKLFDEVFELPHADFKDEYDRLVGLDKTKELLLKEGRLLLKPNLLDDWSNKQHGVVLPAVTQFQRRPPLLLFAGDVGTGKTALANSFGDAIAREENLSITVLRLSLITRGRGAVGEMTTLIGRAFDEVEELLKGGGAPGGRKRGQAAILIIDEADAIAESRAVDQMHHEDKAGVNALIRGIDRFTTRTLSILVVLCTNRRGALDPAIQRRAVSVFHFNRPNHEQIALVLERSLAGALSKADCNQVAREMVPGQKQKYGYTYSDITQRYLPSLLLEAFPDKRVTLQLAIEVAKSIEPTKPFSDE